MLDPQTVLEFQQQFKQLQIHAGLGVTEENIGKVSLICGDLAEISTLLYYQVFPPEKQNFDDVNLADSADETDLNEEEIKLTKQKVTEIDAKQSVGTPVKTK